MKQSIFLFLFFVLSVVCVKAQYSMDVLGGRFEMQTLNMPDDYDGKVITTIIRREARVPTHKAILYVQRFVLQFLCCRPSEIRTVANGQPDGFSSAQSQ